MIRKLAHACLETHDLSALRSTLESRGATIGPISEGADGSPQAWLSDPDGNPIELMEYTHRSLQLHANAPDCLVPRP